MLNIYYIIIINIVIFSVGYLFGKYNNLVSYNYNTRSNNKTISKKINSVNIDEKKVVLNIATQDLEKKYESLGQITIADTDINNSINKLKNLKG